MCRRSWHCATLNVRETLVNTLLFFGRGIHRERHSNIPGISADKFKLAHSFIPGISADELKPALPRGGG